VPHETQRFLRVPTNVRCLYEQAKNLALGAYAQQSSVYSGLDAHLAVDGNTEGQDSSCCISTLREGQPWWQVDLGQYSVIQTIKIWNRIDEPPDKSFEADLFQKRLFPSYVIISRDPFDDKETGAKSLRSALNLSVAKMKLSRNQRCSTWHVPDNTCARYVRLQLEGFEFLHFAQFEVFGTPGINKPVGRCSKAIAGKYATVALIRPLPDPMDIDKAYRRAVLCDSHHADILRHFESFALQYDKYGRGDAVTACIVCRLGKLCEICELKHRYRDERKAMGLGIGGRSLTLGEIKQALLDAPKPPLDYEKKPLAKKSILQKINPFAGNKKKKMEQRKERRTKAKSKTRKGKTVGDNDNDDNDDMMGAGDVGAMKKKNAADSPSIHDDESGERTARSDGDDGSRTELPPI